MDLRTDFENVPKETGNQILFLGIDGPFDVFIYDQCTDTFVDTTFNSYRVAADELAKHFSHWMALAPPKG